MNYKKLHNFISTSARALYGVIDIVLPPRCPQTGDIVPLVGTLSPRAWADLQFIAAPYCACCGIPFPIVDVAELGNNDLVCGACMATPRPYHMARAPLVYNDASRSLILGFKHGDKTHLTVTFAPLLKTYGHEVLKDADILIPVPLHWRRLLKRRYNQSALLVQSLTKLTDIPTGIDVLLRTEHTPPQGHKNARDRHANVKNVFGLNPQYATKMIGKKCVVVDDVFTTGATVEECSKVLLDAGAEQVNILTLARVVRPE